MTFLVPRAAAGDGAIRSECPVEAGGEKLLFDAGRGALQRLFQLKSPVSQVRSIFLTHLHSDHIVGLPDLWMTGWLNGRADTPLKIWGPRGTEEMMKYLDLAFSFDIRIRLYDDRPSPQGIVVMAKDIMEGTIYENNGLTVTAFEVDHAPIVPAFGYRVDYAGKSVVICGDTRYTEHIIPFARGTDVLIYEAIVPDMMRGPDGKIHEGAQRVIDHHAVPEKAGELFTKVNPGLAVYSHIIRNGEGREPDSPDPKNLCRALEVGEDLMAIEIGETIKVNRLQINGSWRKLVLDCTIFTIKVMPSIRN